MREPACCPAARLVALMPLGCCWGGSQARRLPSLGVARSLYRACPAGARPRSLEENGGPLSNPEVLHVLKNREADKQPVLSKALPSEIKARAWCQLLLEQPRRLRPQRGLGAATAAVIAASAASARGGRSRAGGPVPPWLQKLEQALRPWAPPGCRPTTRCCSPAAAW